MQTTHELKPTLRVGHRARGKIPQQAVGDQADKDAAGEDDCRAQDSVVRARGAIGRSMRADRADMDD